MCRSAAPGGAGTRGSGNLAKLAPQRGKVPACLAAESQRERGAPRGARPASCRAPYQENFVCSLMMDAANLEEKLQRALKTFLRDEETYETVVDTFQKGDQKAVDILAPMFQKQVKVSEDTDGKTKLFNTYMNGVKEAFKEATGEELKGDQIQDAVVVFNEFTAVSKFMANLDLQDFQMPTFNAYKGFMFDVEETYTRDEVKEILRLFWATHLTIKEDADKSPSRKRARGLGLGASSSSSPL